MSVGAMEVFVVENNPTNSAMSAAACWRLPSVPSGHSSIDICEFGCGTAPMTTPATTRRVCRGTPGNRASLPRYCSSSRRVGICLKVLSDRFGQRMVEAERLLAVGEGGLKHWIASACLPAAS